MTSGLERGQLKIGQERRRKEYCMSTRWSSIPGNKKTTPKLQNDISLITKLSKSQSMKILLREGEEMTDSGDSTVIAGVKLDSDVCRPPSRRRLVRPFEFQMLNEATFVNMCRNEGQPRPRNFDGLLAKHPGLPSGLQRRTNCQRSVEPARGPRPTTLRNGFNHLFSHNISLLFSSRFCDNLSSPLSPSPSVLPSLDNGEFWLPPQFLLDDDTVHMEKYSANNLKNWSAKDLFGYPETEYGKSLIPYEFPYGFGSLGFSSDLSSPVESVVGSTETESDEEDYLAGLSRQMSHFTLEDDLKRNDLPCGTEKTKGWVLSGSPQSTLCAVGSRCGCGQRSIRGSPNGSSPPATWDLLYKAAGEVERMRMNNEKGCCFNSQSRGVSGPPRKSNPNPNCGVSLYQQQQSLAYQKLQASQLGRQVMQQQQQQSVWGGQSNIKGTGVLFPQMPQQTHPVVQNRGRNITSVCRGPLGLSASAWPPLQNVTQQQHQLQQKNNHGVSGMRAVFLGNPGGKRECAGTGVFLPRQIGTRTESRKKQGCSTVLLPAKVVQALNLNLEGMGAQAQFQPRFHGSFTTDSDTAAARPRNRDTLSHQKHRNGRPQPVMNNEVSLPSEWTY
ncbi:hypothetical protein SADUNF_Sadunf16G0090500 [Salix dunnii]|uniref:Uncharacterized protein n=1 Tax=Salix dunnii TaxID=1413687 RepID=A0A835MIM8_9ROSI|nr:hypothetical protein SADUNF_Sadunf16G0090500 [Salix dunnii]